VVINVGSRGETDTERVLSNFARTPFVLDGRHYNSVEGFWQSLKFPRESDRMRIGLLSGSEAKKAGRDAPKRDTFIYQGQEINVGSPEHHRLMRRALRMKFRFNPVALKLLLETGEEEITHILKDREGNPLPDSKSIPNVVFAKMLMELRSEYQKVFGRGKTLNI
jgi:predicted NAD-dependent protein-ADP-ribosyltransferase YbiA (DUF1768 family)